MAGRIGGQVRPRLHHRRSRLSRDLRRERGYGASPWASGTRFIISHSLLADETYVGGLRDLLSEFRPRALFILDEAHHAAPASGSRYAIDSQFTRSVRGLADRFEHRLFLSATPHNGHSNSFSALLEILDPQRFTRGVPVKQLNVLGLELRQRAMGHRHQFRAAAAAIDRRSKASGPIAPKHEHISRRRSNTIPFFRHGRA